MPPTFRPCSAARRHLGQALGLAAALATVIGLSHDGHAQTSYSYTVIASAITGTAHDPSINDAGQVAFIAGTQRPVLRGDGGPLTPIHVALPPGDGRVSINAAGMVAFRTAGAPARILTGDGTAPATLVAVATNDVGIIHPVINDQGQVVFQTLRSGGNSIVMGSAFTPIASPGDAVPGGVLTSAFAPKINDNGDVAFVAHNTAGPTSVFRLRGGNIARLGPASATADSFGLNNSGVAAFWSAANGGSIVISDGVVPTPTPIAVAGAGFVPEPHRVSINDAGDVAFIAGDGTGEFHRVLVRNGTDLRQVVHVGQTIPELGEVLTVSIGNQAINDGGQVAILVSYDDGSGVAKFAMVRADPPDQDGDDDGVPDDEDAFPNDPGESRDLDGDGIGDNADADDDGDGQSDADEGACGSNPQDAASLSTDTDGDGRPDCVDVNPPPVITPPSTIFAEAAGPDGASVGYLVPVSDPDDGPLVPVCSPPSGTTFPIGTTNVTCEVEDPAGNEASATFAVVVRDTTQPGVFVDAPRAHSLIVDAPVDVRILSNDAVGVTAVTATADVTCTFDFGTCSSTTPTLNLQLTAGTALSGTWTGQLTSPLLRRTLPYILRVTVTDGAGNQRMTSIFVDNDGIGPLIDRARADHSIDQSSIWSREFNTGTTAGTIHHETGLLSVNGTPGAGVRITAELVTPFLTLPPHGGMCTGRDKQFFLDVTGETLDLECTGDTVRARAIVALPEVVVRKLLTGQRCEFGFPFPSCRDTLYWAYAPLTTGYGIRTGSPFEADPENPEPLIVEFRRVEDDGSEVTVGWIVLDPGEIADPEFVAGSVAGSESIVVTAIAGDIEVTFGGETRIVAEGETATAVAIKAPQTIEFAPLPDRTFGEAPSTLTASSTSGLPVSFSSSGSCAVSGSTVTITGVNACSITASQPGNDVYEPAPSVTQSFQVTYSWSGILPPLDAAGGSTVKLGRTVPVKFRLTEASAGITNLLARLYVMKVSDAVTEGSQVPASSTGQATVGTLFRYDAAAGQYIFNWSTEDLSEGTWELRVDLLDGITRSVLVGVKK